MLGEMNSSTDSPRDNMKNNIISHQNDPTVGSETNLMRKNSIGRAQTANTKHSKH